MNSEQQKKDWQWYFTELMSDECQCGNKKQPGHSLCRGCFFALPPDMQRDLYQHIGQGYEAAYDAAVAFINE